LIHALRVLLRLADAHEKPGAGQHDQRKAMNSNQRRIPPQISKGSDQRINEVTPENESPCDDCNLVCPKGASIVDDTPSKGA